ncbi:hypothetical protein EKL30_10480 [Candidimonas sp. SYP-B2681]|uniref:hypothetical protein n=1 Tax=Candidimonas sp. SYP-B2681 TaxID=2497686 RepID=UPI000F864FE1|nr:hypothetical protein [Candidimonas sp. SYP-B2681]RTZ43292.1 hypothetical protein EKL30_10480 [Candidimonas sp. SYP-B2681]
MRKLLAFAICSASFAMAPALYAQSSGAPTSSGAPSPSGDATKNQAPAAGTTPTPKGSMGGTSSSSGYKGTAGATMGEGHKSNGDKGSATDPMKARDQIGGKPTEGAPKGATPPGTSANDSNASKSGTGGKTAQ